MFETDAYNIINFFPFCRSNYIFMVFLFQGVSALSEFHSHFIDSLHSLTRGCVVKRDMLMKQLLEAKDSGFSGDTTTADNETLNTSECGQGLELPHQTST